MHHDLWDYDNTSAPKLMTVKHNGKTVDVVAQAGKTGFLYVFDRVTGEPIWPIEERPVPTKTDVPGEQVWPTQPFPTAPPPFARQTFTVDDINPYMLTPRGAGTVQAAHRQRARNEGLFTPIGFSEAIHMPGNNGGSNFGSTSSNPTDGTRLRDQLRHSGDHAASHTAGSGGSWRAAVAAAGAGGPGLGIFQRDCQACHGADRAGTRMARR